jgi:hypothetical protein
MGPLFGQAVGLVMIAFGTAVSFAVVEDAALALELVVVAHA